MFTLAVTHLLVPKVDWRKAISANAIDNFAKSISDLLSPLLNNSSYDDISKLDNEVRTVCNEVCSLAEELLPKRFPRKQSQSNFVKDNLLKLLCTHSKAAWMDWKNAGRPLSGELLQRETSTKKEVQKRITTLRARRDRLNTEHVDDKFRELARKCFRTHCCGSAPVSRLMVDNSLTTKQEDVMAAWVSHFTNLGASRACETPRLKQLCESMSALYADSLNNIDLILGCSLQCG